jgi:hypothetical protein
MISNVEKEYSHYSNRRNHSSVNLINKNTFYAGLRSHIRKILMVFLSLSMLFQILCRVGTYFQPGLNSINSMNHMLRLTNCIRCFIRPLG